MKEPNKDILFLNAALEEAKKAIHKDEVPIGAVIVYQNEIIGRGHNEKEYTHDVTGHAEIIAIKDASQNIKNWRLNDCVLYTTLEPCPMCFGAILHARLKKVIYGAKDLKWGACGTITDLSSLTTFNHQTNTEYIHYEPGKKIIQAFFKEKRN